MSPNMADRTSNSRIVDTDFDYHSQQKLHSDRTTRLIQDNTCIVLPVKKSFDQEEQDKSQILYSRI